MGRATEGFVLSFGHVPGQRIVGMHLGPRCKWDHPYNYDPLLTYETGEKATGFCYSDHFRSWYAPKVLEAAKLKHLGKDADYYSEFSVEQITNLLRDLMEKPTLKVVTIEEHCNQSTGFPLWYFAYQIAEDLPAMETSQRKKTRAKSKAKAIA